MPQLIQLPDGNWICPTLVQSVVAAKDASVPARHQSPQPRVIVRYGAHVHVIDAPDYEVARRWAFAIAYAVNNPEQAERTAITMKVSP